MKYVKCINNKNVEDIKELGLRTKEQKQSIVSKETMTRAEQKFESLKKQELKVGDKVRVRTEALHSNIRKNIKAGLSKLVTVKFSTKVYQISKVVKGRGSLGLNRYIIEDSKNKVLLEEFNMKRPNAILQPRKMNITDLLKIDPNTITSRNKKIETKLNLMDYDKIEDEQIEAKPITRKSKRIANIEKKKDKEKNKDIVIEPTRRSTRERKQKEVLDL